MDENKMPENDGWKKNARLAIYAMAGFYLLTLAYQMFRAISTSHGNEQLVMIVATILFLIVGVGLIGKRPLSITSNVSVFIFTKFTHTIWVLSCIHLSG